MTETTTITIRRESDGRIVCEEVHITDKEMASYVIRPELTLLFAWQACREKVKRKYDNESSRGTAQTI